VSEPGFDLGDSGTPEGKFLRRLVAGRRVWTLAVVVLAKGLNDLPRLFQAREPVLIQALISEPRVETSTKPFCIGLPESMAYGYSVIEHTERLDEGLELVKRAVAPDSDNGSYLDSLGWAYFKMGNPEQAERYLLDAARLEPESAEILEHVGDLHARRGRTEQAREAWTKAAALSDRPEDTKRLKSKLGEERREKPAVPRTTP
jgi:tetratricopeptide (TPR) repeat protein